MTTDPGELFRTVEEYCAIGEHRTGTPADRATADWLAARLRALGAPRVDVRRFGFERYDARWSLAIDGDPVVSIPLFYEGVGRAKTSDPATGTLRVRGGSVLPDWRELAERARSDGAPAALIATDAGTGRLCAPNRQVLPGSGLLTLCVAGRLGERLGSARVDLDLEAEVVPGEGYNVVAELGAGRPEQRVLITTPLSGWFRCAGERGTGIAVALAVAETLAQECPVTFAGTSGHELMGVGVRHHLASGPIAEKAVFHFGASVASGDADGLAPPTRRSRAVRASAWLGDARRDEIREALEPLGIPIRLPPDAEARDPRGWMGESAAWAPLGKPLVSIAGGFPLHHAPEDLPALATTRALLSESREVALAAARVLASV